MLMPMMAAESRERQDDSLAPVESLQELGQQVKRQRIPLLILFSTPGCLYCVQVRQNYLKPRLQEHPKSMLIAEINMTSTRRIRDFNGRWTTEAAVAQRYGVKMAPYVLFFDAEGTVLTEPLIGIDQAGFYEGYLEQQLQRAHKALKP